MELHGWKINQYDWENELWSCSNQIIKETGMSRDELQKVLQILSDYEIVKAKVIN